MEEISRDRAKALLGQGDFDGAIAILRELTTTEPTDALAWQMLGAAYGAAGQSPESIGAFHHAVELQPSSARAQFNLALALIKADRGSEARSHLERALALDPGYEAARSRLADLGGAVVAPVVAPAPVAPPPAPDVPEAPVKVAAPPASGGLSALGGLSSIGGGAPPAPEISSGAPPPLGAAPPGGYAPPPAAYRPAGFDRPTAAPDVEAGKALTYAIVGFFCLGIILGPIAISMASKGLSTLDQYPHADQSQRGTLNTARVIGIVVTVLSVLGCIIRLATLGSTLSGGNR